MTKRDTDFIYHSNFKYAPRSRVMRSIIFWGPLKLRWWKWQSSHSNQGAAGTFKAISKRCFSEDVLEEKSLLIVNAKADGTFTKMVENEQKSHLVRCQKDTIRLWCNLQHTEHATHLLNMQTHALADAILIFGLFYQQGSNFENNHNQNAVRIRIQLTRGVKSAFISGGCDLSVLNHLHNARRTNKARFKLRAVTGTPPRHGAVVLNLLGAFDNEDGK
ncbi:hypothetical protein CDAR_80641 [Caerostris darwini]|uniref:Uncharacterized protein n=1 Tax=Caerostris darwini TaxID=1538125 RepID=A0AAV4PEJ8_9ARAC|nr:hypothetical protein CDAR_80641 [Caerostris darwini]